MTEVVEVRGCDSGVALAEEIDRMKKRGYKLTHVIPSHFYKVKYEGAIPHTVPESKTRLGERTANFLIDSYLCVFEN